MKCQITAEQKQEIERARKNNKNKQTEKRLKVLYLRAEGASYKEIIKATGYSKANILVDNNMLSDEKKSCRTWNMIASNSEKYITMFIKKLPGCVSNCIVRCLRKTMFPIFMIIIWILRINLLRMIKVNSDII